jgi:hypothetical protein
MGNVNDSAKTLTSGDQSWINSRFQLIATSVIAQTLGAIQPGHFQNTWK